MMSRAGNLAPIAGPEDLAEVFNVSRETIGKLIVYEGELKRWQKAVNLISPSTLPEIWHRHFADSAQVADFIPSETRSLVDVGSGGGFPGLILAVLLRESRDLTVTLVESDTRKAAFLRETARRMEIPVEILSTRIESDATVKLLNSVDTVTARAFAPLDRLFSLVSPVFSCATVGVFLKGREIGRELDEAAVSWDFEHECFNSRTDAWGRIVVVRNLTRKPEA